MSPVRMSRVESALRLVMAFNEAFNRHDIQAMMRLMSSDCVFENTQPAPDGTTFRGKDVVAQFWQSFFNESPHAHIEIEDAFGMGEHCVLRWKYHWKNSAGEAGHVRGVDIFKVQDGLITEKLSYVKG